MSEIPDEAVGVAAETMAEMWNQRLSEEDAPYVPSDFTSDARDVLAAAAPIIRADERQRIIAEIQASDLGAPVKLDPYSGTAHFLTGSELRERICAFIAERGGE